MTANESAKAPSAALFSTTMSARVASSAGWTSVSGRIRSVIAIARTPSLKRMIRSTLASRSCAVCSPSLSPDQLPPLAMAKYRSRHRATRWPEREPSTGLVVALDVGLSRASSSAAVRRDSRHRLEASVDERDRRRPLCEELVGRSSDQRLDHADDAAVSPLQPYLSRKRRSRRAGYLGGLCR
jgi:hypothetical protein